MSDAENIIKIYRELSSKFSQALQTVGEENKDIDAKIFIVASHKAIKHMFQSNCVTVIKQVPDTQSGLNHILSEIENIKSNIEREIQVK